MPIGYMYKHKQILRRARNLRPIAVAWIALAAFFIGLSGVQTELATAETVKMQAWDHKTFGRIVFEWQSPVRHSAQIADGRLVLEFARPVVGAIGDLHKKLSAYVGNFRLSEDGRTVTAALKGSLRLRNLARGNRIIIDLIRVSSDVSQPASESPAGTSPKPCFPAE